MKKRIPIIVAAILTVLSIAALTSCQSENKKEALDRYQNDSIQFAKELDSVNKVYKLKEDSAMKAELQNLRKDVLNVDSL